MVEHVEGPIFGVQHLQLGPGVCNHKKTWIWNPVGKPSRYRLSYTTKGPTQQEEASCIETEKDVSMKLCASSSIPGSNEAWKVKPKVFLEKWLFRRDFQGSRGERSLETPSNMKQSFFLRVTIYFFSCRKLFGISGWQAEIQQVQAWEKPYLLNLCQLGSCWRHRASVGVVVVKQTQHVSSKEILLSGSLCTAVCVTAMSIVSLPPHWTVTINSNHKIMGIWNNDEWVPYQWRRWPAGVALRWGEG